MSDSFTLTGYVTGDDFWRIFMPASNILHLNSLWTVTCERYEGNNFKNKFSENRNLNFNIFGVTTPNFQILIPVRAFRVAI